MTMSQIRTSHQNMSHNVTSYNTEYTLFLQSTTSLHATTHNVIACDSITNCLVTLSHYVHPIMQQGHTRHCILHHSVSLSVIQCHLVSLSVIHMYAGTSPAGDQCHVTKFGTYIVTRHCVPLCGPVSQISLHIMHTHYELRMTHWTTS